MRTFYSKMAAEIREIAKANGFEIQDEKFARFLDENDELKSCRSEFHYPKNKTLPPSKQFHGLVSCRRFLERFGFSKFSDKIINLLGR